MIYWELFYRFFKIGLFAIGGGLATLPFLADLSAETGWFSTADITNMIAVSQSTPGPIGINMAAYTGQIVAGVGGAVAAVLGLVMPSLIIIVLIAGLLQKFKASLAIKALFGGLKPASLALIFGAWLGVLKLSFWPPKGMESLLLGLVFAFLFWLLHKKKLHPIWILGLGALAGILIY